MRHERLLRLYPRAWRERYGQEFLATVGQGPPSLQQVIDIVSGAIDAWLSADVRRATMAPDAAPGGGGPMILKSLMACERKQANYTRRDSMIGAGVMIGATLVFSVLAIAARRGGLTMTGDVMLSLAFPGSLTLSMPFWVMKGQPWKAQVVIVGGTLLFLIVIGCLASLI
ncbi:MAG: hypothetical protein ACREAA_02530 [Candidatus Polarisedimenticolia bacterium]